MSEETVVPTAPQSTGQTNLPIWKPTILQSQIPMNVYRAHVNRKFSINLRNSHELHRWSVEDPQAFWVDLWNYVGLIPDLPPGTKAAYDSSIPISDVPPFFEEEKLNYAENALFQPTLDPSAPALVGIREGQSIDGDVWSWDELRECVRKIRSALLRSGIRKGDRVAALISTSVWSVALFLGAASIGAIFTSIAPDLGKEVQTLSMSCGSANRPPGVHISSSTSYAFHLIC